MRPADRRRRHRRIALLLLAILIPTSVVVVLVVRLIRQESELSARRESEQRREALEQLRRELSARLQALRLAEVNRIIGEPGREAAADSPIVFVAPMLRDRLILPWEDERPFVPPSSSFLAVEGEAEALEFQARDAPAAVAAYRRLLALARTPQESCRARLALGRVLRTAALTAEAQGIDRDAVARCEAVADEDGVPLALYAAERLLGGESQDAAAADYAVRSATRRRWHHPNEAYALQALLRRLPDETAAAPLRALASEIHDLELLLAFARESSRHLDRLRDAARSGPGDLAWVGYGEEPWLITLVSPASFAAPVVMAVSSRRIAPADVTLRAASTAAAVPLGDGFVDLYAEWPIERSAATSPVSPVVPAAMLILVLGAALMIGYLALRDVHREADTAELRSHFVASVSHELKTPLTSIRAHAETLLLGRTGSPEATAEYLRTIVSESERLTRLVDSVLDFSRIEQGRKVYHMQAMRLEDIVRSAAAAMGYPLSQLGFTLTQSSDGSDPAVMGDPEALTQAVLNLIGNAMKYSGDARQIELRLGTRGHEAFVDVVDHGIGIAREDQSRIFERFHRVQSPATAGIAGTGLGLALVRHVVEAHRGRIAVVSDVGAGSTFSLWIPLQEQA